MKLVDLAEILDAEPICCHDNLKKNVSFVYAGDLMSDILMYSSHDAVLLTGLVNVQVIRTAEMLDVSAIIFIRGKRPTEEMVQIAEQKQIPLLTTANTLYLSCGLLYEAGLKTTRRTAANRE